MTREMAGVTSMCQILMDMANCGAFTRNPRSELPWGHTMNSAVSRTGNGGNYCIPDCGFRRMAWCFTHSENTLNALGPNDVMLGTQTAPDFSGSQSRLPSKSVLARCGLNY